MKRPSLQHLRVVSLLALFSGLALLILACGAPATTSPQAAPTSAPTTSPPAAPTSAPATTSPPAAPTSAPTAPAAAKKIELTFWKHNHTPADDLTKTLISEYQTKNPNVTIKMEIVPNDVFFTKLATALAGDQAPDMYDINDATIPSYISKGVLAPADPAAFGFANQAELEKAFVPNSLNSFKGPDGKVYGIPFEYNSWVFVINDRLFKEAGLDPAKDYPKTWEQVGEIGAKLAKVSGGRFERQGFSWNLLTSGWTMLQYPPIVYQLGGSVLSDDDKGKQCALNSPEGIKALQTMQDIYYKYKAGAPGINVSTAADAMADFTQEKAAMWFLGPWAVPFFKDNPTVWQNYRIVPLPQASDGKRKVVALSSWTWVVNSKASKDNQTEAWKFTNYASQQGARWLPTAGYVLPRLGWTDSPEAKAFKGLDVFIEQMQYGRPRLVHPNASEINAIVHKAAQEALLNNKPAKEVLDTACADINKITNK